MLTNDTKLLAIELEEILETSVDSGIIALLDEETRDKLRRELYKWSIGKASDESIKIIAENTLKLAQQEFIKSFKYKYELSLKRAHIVKAWNLIN
jgi:hypothetical protein